MQPLLEQLHDKQAIIVGSNYSLHVPIPAAIHLPRHVQQTCGRKTLQKIKQLCLDQNTKRGSKRKPVASPSTSPTSGSPVVLFLPPTMGCNETLPSQRGAMFNCWTDAAYVSLRKGRKNKISATKADALFGSIPRCHDIPFLLHTHRLSSMIIVRWTNIVFQFRFFSLFYFYVQTDASLLRLPRSHTRHVLQRL